VRGKSAKFDATQHVEAPLRDFNPDAHGSASIPRVPAGPPSSLCRSAMPHPDEITQRASHVLRGRRTSPTFLAPPLDVSVVPCAVATTLGWPSKAFMEDERPGRGWGNVLCWHPVPHQDRLGELLAYRLKCLRRRRDSASVRQTPLLLRRGDFDQRRRVVTLISPVSGRC